MCFRHDSGAIGCHQRHGMLGHDAPCEQLCIRLLARLIPLFRFLCPYVVGVVFYYG